MASQSKEFEAVAGAVLPIQVATVVDAKGMLESGSKVQPLERALTFNGYRYSYQILRNKSAKVTAGPLFLISDGAIRALRHQGLLKELLPPTAQQV